jgi:hypothetical protein
MFVITYRTVATFGSPGERPGRDVEFAAAASVISSSHRQRQDERQDAEVFKNAHGHASRKNLAGGLVPVLEEIDPRHSRTPMWFSFTPAALADAG